MTVFQKRLRVPMKEEFRYSGADCCFGLISLFCLLFLIFHSSIASVYIYRGILLCAKSLIPALFPCMILSELLLYGKTTRKLFSKLFSPIAKFLRLSSPGCLAFCFGLLCGFPIGARIALRAKEAGSMEKEEVERVIATASVPSLAFLVGVVGKNLWQSAKFGLFLWILLSISAIFFAAGFRNFAPCDVKFGQNESFSVETSFPKFFTRAVQSCAQNMLLICAYVLFFSAVIGILESWFSVLPFPPMVKVWIFCFLEISTGVNAAADISSPILTAFALGWSGLSVHAQLLSVCDGHFLSFRKYFFVKALQALFCMGIVFVCTLLFPSFP